MINKQLQKYINVVTWDLQKMYKVAEDVQAAIEQETIIEQEQEVARIPSVTPIATPNIKPTTTNHQDHREDFYDYHKPEHAQCAIPIAMVLTSSIDFIGALLSHNNLFVNTNKFDSASKNFFKYLEDKGGNFGEKLHKSDNQRKLLFTIFRNGLMHDFFPKGVDVAIAYDKNYEHNKLFFLEQDKVVLNVYKLRLIVEWVFDRINNDQTIADKIAARLKDYEDSLNTKKGIIDDFKTNNESFH